MLSRATPVEACRMNGPFCYIEFLHVLGTICQRPALCRDGKEPKNASGSGRSAEPLVGETIMLVLTPLWQLPPLYGEGVLLYQWRRHLPLSASRHRESSGWSQFTARPGRWQSWDSRRGLVHRCQPCAHSGGPRGLIRNRSVSPHRWVHQSGRQSASNRGQRPT
jgi:hypothetical protein